MSIRHRGGVFGNNPKFRNVSVDTLTVAGATMTFPATGASLARTDAAQSFAGNQTLSNGNLVMGTAGKGIDFSADVQSTGMTSELLNDYEEGTWTPTQGANLTVNGVFSSSGSYTKIGRQVTIIGTIAGSTSLSVVSGGVICGGLPFTVSGFGLGGLAVSNAGVAGVAFAAATNVISQTAVGPVSEIYFSATYFV